MKYLITGTYTVYRMSDGGQAFTNTANFEIEAKDPETAKKEAVKLIVNVYPFNDIDTNFTAKPA